MRLLPALPRPVAVTEKASFPPRPAALGCFLLFSAELVNEELRCRTNWRWKRKTNRCTSRFRDPREFVQKKITKRRRSRTVKRDLEEKRKGWGRRPASASCRSCGMQRWWPWLARAAAPVAMARAAGQVGRRGLAVVREERGRARGGRKRPDQSRTTGTCPAAALASQHHAVPTGSDKPGRHAVGRASEGSRSGREHAGQGGRSWEGCACEESGRGWARRCRQAAAGVDRDRGLPDARSEEVSIFSFRVGVGSVRTGAVEKTMRMWRSPALTLLSKSMVTNSL
jgi:hypothetical protein